jgi:hypothetical protein
MCRTITARGADVVGQRLEVRLDEEHQRMLATVLEARGIPVSDVVRQLIESAYEEIALARRLEAVQRLAALEGEDMPDPDELSRQLAKTYDIPDLY